MKFKQIMSLANKIGFLKSVAYPKVNIEQLKAGPIGIFLEEILKTEWLNATVINKDLPIFLSDDNVTETYEFAKNICLETLPFGIAETVKHKKKSIQDLVGISEIADQLEFSKMFVHIDSCTLKCTIFVASNASTQFFHQWQRQRNMWWRKLSASPGRYSLTDTRNGIEEQSVDILAKYPWGSQHVETVTLSSLLDRRFCSSQFKKEGNKSVQLHMVTSTVHLPTMVLNIICDSYNKLTFHGKTRELFQFHRKLAPYKLTFVLNPSGSSIQVELVELATYLCRQLRDHNISALLVPNNAKFTLEAQYRQQDELGAPYSVVLNDTTLADGLCHLRSRDTTLKEQVHVTDLLGYTEKLFKNY